jgi:ATP-dependent Zn protease
VRDLSIPPSAHTGSLFIDEIDAVGRHRGAGMVGWALEREQTLNQSLSRWTVSLLRGIIEIAGDKRRNILDPALLRPCVSTGRLRSTYPDVKGREEIEGHSGNNRLRRRFTSRSWPSARRDSPVRDLIMSSTRRRFLPPAKT